MNEHRHDTPSTLEDATRESRQRLVAVDSAVADALPREGTLQVEVNGIFAGSIEGEIDAPKELAVGWLMLHGFCNGITEVDHVVAHDDRVALMSRSGVDVERARISLYGAAPRPKRRLSVPKRDEEWSIPEDVLLDVMREARRMARRDGAGEGYRHAMLADQTSVQCIARDRECELAVAKVIGWAALGAAPQPMLGLAGQLTRRMIEAAAIVGVRVICCSGVPTRDALLLADRLDVSVVGLSDASVVGLFVDTGVVRLESR